MARWAVSSGSRCLGRREGLVKDVVLADVGKQVGPQPTLIVRRSGVDLPAASGLDEAVGLDRPLGDSLQPGAGVDDVDLEVVRHGSLEDREGLVPAPRGGQGLGLAVHGLGEDLDRPGQVRVVGLDLEEGSRRGVHQGQLAGVDVLHPELLGGSLVDDAHDLGAVRVGGAAVGSEELDDVGAGEAEEQHADVGGVVGEQVLAQLLGRYVERGPPAR